MTTQTVTKSVSKTVAKQSKASKVIAFRFALTPEIEIIINSLELCYMGLDRSEIVKLALNQLYKNNNLDRDNQSIVKQISAVKSNTFETDDQFFDYWNANKSELR